MRLAQHWWNRFGVFYFLVNKDQQSSNSINFSIFLIFSITPKPSSMKKTLLFITAILISWQFLTTAAKAGHFMYPVPIEERVANSSLIIEGKVLSQYSFWSEGRQSIYTSSQVQVLKKLKGQLSAEVIEIITEGGTVENERITHTGTLSLYPGQIGIFFCARASFSGIHRPDAYMVFSSLQGFIQYDLPTGTASHPFKTYPRISEARDEIVHATGLPFESLTHDPALDKAEQQRPHLKTTATPVITTFTPALVTGGTQMLLTITGSNFGAVQGTGFVEFPNANDGGGSYVRPVASDYVLWSDNQIIVRVPSSVVNPSGVAGSGIFRVTNSDPSTGVSPSPLTIIYSHTNVNDGGTPAQPDLVNDNGTGGYTFQYNVNFASNTAATAAFSRALSSWCPSQVNWTVGAPTAVNVAALDNVNVVRFDVGTELPVGNAGRLTSYYTGCGPVGGPFNWYVNEMDIVFDDATNWNYGPGLPSFSQYDFESVALHELGHGIQLNHVIDPTNVMHYNISNGQTKRTLNADDIAGGTYVVTKSAIPNSCGPTPMIPFPCPLPVTLLEFNGHYSKGEGAAMAWRVADEKTIDGYVLQRSADGTAFDNIGFVDAVNGTGEREYHFVDADFKDPSYYRLQVKDLTGTDSYSNIVKIRLQSAPAVTVYPNPAGNTINLRSPEPIENGVFTLRSSTGKLVFDQHMQIPNGTREFVIKISELAPGLYFYNLISGNNQYTGRFTKL